MDLVKRRRSTNQMETEIRNHLISDVENHNLTGERKREHLNQIKYGTEIEIEHISVPKRMGAGAGKAKR